MAILLRVLFLVSISKSKQGRQLFKLDYLFIAIESGVYAIGYKWIDYIVCLHRRRSLMNLQWSVHLLPLSNEISCFITTQSHPSLVILHEHSLYTITMVYQSQNLGKHTQLQFGTTNDAYIICLKEKKSLLRYHGQVQ